MRPLVSEGRSGSLLLCIQGSGEKPWNSANDGEAASAPLTGQLTGDDVPIVERLRVDIEAVMARRAGQERRGEKTSKRLLKTRGLGSKFVVFGVLANGTAFIGLKSTADQIEPFCPFGRCALENYLIKMKKAMTVTAASTTMNRAA